MRSRMIVMMLIAALPASAMAAKLHKCVDAEEAVSIQSAPCPADQRTAWVRDVEPDPETLPVRPARPRSASPARQATRYAQPVYRAPPHDPKKAACDAARASAEHTRDKYWDKLNFEGRRRLDEQVRLACR